MKLNVNKNIISGNILLPFYFLPHALNISLFIRAVVNGQDLPRLPFGICKVTNIFWKIKRFSLSEKCYSKLHIPDAFRECFSIYCFNESSVQVGYNYFIIFHNYSSSIAFLNLIS